MCGIAGIIDSTGNVTPFLIHALDKLSNRGYDGFGICVGKDLYKTGQNGLDELKALVHEKIMIGTTGVTHNRWATHGPATQENAHPHRSGGITIVHNGDIDNYDELKKKMTAKGFSFFSETDTEVFAVLVSYYRAEHDFFNAVKMALLELGPTSTYAFLVMDQANPNQIIAARKGSRPLLWSLTENSTYIASEEAALHGFVQTYQELFEGDIVLFEAGKLVMRENMTAQLQGHFKTYEIDPEHYTQPEKTSGYWMYQEMMDAPNVIAKVIGKRATMQNGIMLGGIQNTEIQKRLREVDRFIFIGCGTSFHSCQIMADSMQEIAGIPAEAIIASEAIYKTTVFNAATTALVVVSQSGETADVVRLMNEWKPRGVLMLGIVNVANTQITRLTDAGIYCHAGREVAVASTKAFLGQVVCGVMFAISMGQQRGLSVSKRNRYIHELLSLPQKAAEVLKQREAIERIANEYASYQNFLFIGRKYSATVALEGALKLKEITWNGKTGIHALGISSGEMKHGTLAMINDQFPTFVIGPNDSVFGPLKKNISEIRARNGKIILITTTDAPTEDIAPEHIIYIPQTIEIFSTILSVIPTQIFAFYASIARGCNPDMPFNLAKAVTVE